MSLESVFTVAGPGIAGVLLAAGRSTRMGRPKQLARLGTEPLCRHAARALAGAGFARLLAVVSPDETGAEIQAALAGLGFGFVVNPAPARGLASSFRAAAQSLGHALDAAQFALADMPFVTAETHRAVQAAFRHSGAPVVVTRYGQEQAVTAPPTLFQAGLWPELAALPDEDQGPREMIRRCGQQVVTVQRPAAELTDIDTPEQLLQARVRWAARCQAGEAG